VKFLQIRANCT